MKQQFVLMTVTDWVGGAAAALVTIALIPQAWKVWRTKHTADITLGMYILFTTGIVLWLAYGILPESWPIIAANSCTLVLAGTVLAMKIKLG
jgi:MtN3 and saliva related transmembrane protein